MTNKVAYLPAQALLGIGIGFLSLPLLAENEAGKRDIEAFMSQTERSDALPWLKQQYAEAMYLDFTKYSGGRVTFDLHPRTEGSMSTLKGMKIEDVLPEPSYVLTSIDGETSIEALAFDSPKSNEAHIDERKISLDEFSRVGFPLSNGRFRLLSVTMKMGDEELFHDAVEFCWPEQNHCVLIDNSLPFIDSQVREHRITEAEPRFAKIFYGPELPIQSLSDVAIKHHGSPTVEWCRLNSRNASFANYSVPSKTFRKENALGQLLYKGTIGAVSGGFSCTPNGARSACVMTASSSVSASEGSAYRNYSIACSRAHVNPEASQYGKIDAETGCSVAQPGSTAKFSLGIKGVGLSAEVVTLEKVGTVRSNLLSRTDSCIPIYSSTH